MDPGVDDATQTPRLADYPCRTSRSMSSAPVLDLWSAVVTTSEVPACTRTSSKQEYMPYVHRRQESTTLRPRLLSERDGEDRIGRKLPVK